MHLHCPSSRMPRLVTVDVIEGIVIAVSAFRLVQRFLCFFVVGALALSYVLPSMAVDFNRFSVATSLALRGEEMGTTHHYLQLLVDNTPPNMLVLKLYILLNVTISDPHGLPQIHRLIIASSIRRPHLFCCLTWRTPSSHQCSP